MRRKIITTAAVLVWRMRRKIIRTAAVLVWRMRRKIIRTAAVLVWRMRRKIIRTAVCRVVDDSCAHLQRIRGIYDNALYKSTFTLHYIVHYNDMQVVLTFLHVR